MTLHLFPTARDAAAALAAAVVTAIRENPSIVLGLPTGRTPVVFYRELVRRIRRDAVDISGVSTFTLDEFLGVHLNELGSCRSYMERHLFERIRFSRERVHFLDGSTPGPGAECARYEEAIVAAGGIDLQILGIGANGHIGFNEPGDWLSVRTHRETLRPETRRANADLFGGSNARAPREALSMGMGTIHRARRVVLLATGATKAGAIARTIAGPITTLLPASFLLLHSAAEVWLDRAAAADIQPATGEWQPSQPFWPAA